MASAAFAKGDVELSMSEPWDSSLNINPKFKYTQASIFGQGTVPSYKGMAYGAEIEYIVGTQALSIGPYFEIVSADLENTASSPEQAENLEGTFTSGGLKLTSGLIFLKLGGSKMKIKNVASGTVNNSKAYESNGLELGGGIAYSFSNYFGATAGLDLAYYKISPGDNPINTRLDYMSYSLVIGLVFSIPSGK